MKTFFYFLLFIKCSFGQTTINEIKDKGLFASKIFKIKIFKSEKKIFSTDIFKNLKTDDYYKIIDKDTVYLNYLNSINGYKLYNICSGNNLKSEIGFDKNSETKSNEFSTHYDYFGYSLLIVDCSKKKIIFLSLNTSKLYDVNLNNENYLIISDSFVDYVGVLDSNLTFLYSWQIENKHPYFYKYNLINGIYKIKELNLINENIDFFELKLNKLYKGKGLKFVKLKEKSENVNLNYW